MVPTPHAVHIELPDVTLKVPLGHGEQRPSSDTVVPGGQGAQLVSEEEPCGEKRDIGHGWQL